MRSRPFRIAVSVEHSRGWGRRVCEGVCSYAQAHPDWRITMFDGVLPSAADMKAFDGFLWSVSDACAAERLLSTGRPIVNLMVDGRFPGTVQVGADHVACGELVVRHFLSRYFRHFAFCGWRGLVFSDVRLAAYRAALGRVHFDCSAYLTKAGMRRRTLLRDVLHERFALPADAKAIARWLKRLPKPVAVFCANDLRAWQLSEICWRAGLSVPKEVAILGADNDIVPCLLTSPSLSSVDTATFETGRRAAEVLDEILHGTRAADGATVLVPPRGVAVRNSTAVYAVEPPFLAEALSWIRADTAKSLTAAEVAAHVGLSYSTVQGAFRDRIGSSIQREIMSARLELAERLLSMTDLPLSDVAVQAGFRTQQYFCLCFRREKGMAPGSFRAQAGRRG